ncbi:uncharacterized protein LOC121386939 [Gigantopelta aegis]|uniref:uncharacterized protein LOC121386939 n=1 Tax=Gigantopelta aegis TaxID=1735272 RepID=UPI001B88981C|nr:uncharacterized protein LOC121386939 [Gigantopelta aegis]
MGANTGMSNGSVPQDWSGATQPRQAMGGTNTVLSLNRLNDPTNFQAYPAPLRQQGVDYGYMYETPPKGAGQSLNDSSSYLYHGYGHSSDYQMYGENNNKRRVETEGANRNYKRTKPDSYYYDNIQSGFA